MPRRSSRHRKAETGAKASEVDQTSDEDDGPLSALAVGKSRRQQAPRCRESDARRSKATALQQLASIRNARRSNATGGRATSTDMGESSEAPVSTQDRSAGSEWRPASATRQVSSSDDASDDEPLAESARKRAQTLASTPAAAVKSRRRAALNAKPNRSQAPRSRFVTGAEQASSSDSGDGLEGFIASDSEEHEQRARAKRKRPQRAEAGQRARSTRAKLDWPDSSDGEDQPSAQAGRPVAARIQDADDDAQADEEDEGPKPVKRARRISHILDGEEGWEEAYAASQPVDKAMRKLPERNNSDSDGPIQANRKKRHVAAVTDKAVSEGDDDEVDNLGPSNSKAANTQKSEPDRTSHGHHLGLRPACSGAQPSHHSGRLQRHPQPDDDLAVSGRGRRSRRRQAQDEEQEQEGEAAAAAAVEEDEAGEEDQERLDQVQEGFDSADPAARLAEEGLDPLPQGGLPQRATRRVASGPPTNRLDIRAKMQQNQQRLRRGGRRKRRSAADPFLANRIQHVYDGHGFAAPSESDSEESESEPASASEDSEEGNEAEEEDLDDFIVHDMEEGPAPNADADGDHTSQPHSILEEAGFSMRQSDGDYFRTYVEYLVYDLVDTTFAVRVGRDSRLHRYYNTAVKHVEEKMGYRREACVTSSAWMQAVAGLMDNLDTLPGLSSEWSEDSPATERQDGVCQACQKGQTLGHAVKTLTLKGRPYTPKWKYGYRRVSNAHVRKQAVPAGQDDEATGDGQDEDGLDGRQEIAYAVGRFCCARLQMYHALMHYKHRLRGKLKKRIKAEYRLQRLRRERQDWTEAAKTFLGKQSLMQSLYKNYNSLIETATNFSTQGSSSWRKTMNILGSQVDSLLYQLNSDSEGDEGSDIDPEAEDDAQQGSGSGSSGDGQDNSTAQDQAASSEGAGTHLRAGSGRSPEVQRDKHDVPADTALGERSRPMSPHKLDHAHQSRAEGAAASGHEGVSGTALSVHSDAHISEIGSSSAGSAAVPSHSYSQLRQGLSASTQDLPASTQGLLASTQGLPASTQGLPASTQGLPAATQGLPAASQGLPASSQGLSAASQALTTSPDRIVASCQADNLATVIYGAAGTAEATALPDSAALGPGSGSPVSDGTPPSTEQPVVTEESGHDQKHDAGDATGSPQSATLNLAEEAAATKAGEGQAAGQAALRPGSPPHKRTVTSPSLQTTPIKRSGSGSAALSPPTSSGKAHRQADIRNFFRSP